MAVSSKPDRARRLLAKPIKFFYEMRELFIGSNADGSLAMDQNTCMNADDGSDSDESRGLIDLNCYTQPKDLEGEDSDTLPTPTRHAAFSDSTDHFERKRPRANNSVREEAFKKPRKKSRLQIPLMK
ncbi:hypothetical protein C2845_PM05G03150 [Panicum miliaceum]|uniref:Uncharacterized protein n=1 Tax=Panicum miliaceum TaxID=4540 RepID=A0A3L6T3R7_PANMI|nr:hypothetical protein C2845_PM05G03150 [Panicum miliaceum]